MATNATVPPIIVQAEPFISAPSDVDFSQMTKQQLLAYAEEHGVAGVNRSMLKAHIIEAIEGASA